MTFLSSVIEEQPKNCETKPYYELSPDVILEDICQIPAQIRIVEIKKLKMLCFPHVYPSDRFRTTNFLLDSIQPFLKDTTLCDMGCGPGIVGLYAVREGAKKVIQADINHFAVQNAKENKKYHNISNEKNGNLS